MKKIGAYLSTFTVILLVILTGWLLYQRSEGKSANLFGYQLYHVLSGSMMPTMDVGSLVIVQTMNPDDVRPNDIITFKDDTGNITTHRVVSVQEDSYVTKGDANEVIDPFHVKYKDLLGKVVFTVPFVGAALQIIQDQPMILLIVVIGIGLLGLGIKQCVTNNR